MSPRLERRLATATAHLRQAVDLLDQAQDRGHATYCHAICGPEHATWLEHNKCDCGLHTKVAVIDAAIAASTTGSKG